MHVTRPSSACVGNHFAPPAPLTQPHSPSPQSVTAALRAYVAANLPELLDPIFNDPKGADPENNPQAATLASLVNLYVESPAYVLTGAPANLALYRRRLVLDAGVTILDYNKRAQDRVGEIAAQQAAVAALSLAGPLGSSKVGDITAAFASAGGSATALPDPAALPQGFATGYNLAAWAGNTTAYMLCDLGHRAPSYVGTCQALTLSCVESGNDTAPYTCISLANNTPITGNVSGECACLGLGAELQSRPPHGAWLLILGTELRSCLQRLS